MAGKNVRCYWIHVCTLSEPNWLGKFRVTFGFPKFWVFGESSFMAVMECA